MEKEQGFPRDLPKMAEGQVLCSMAKTSPWPPDTHHDQAGPELVVICCEVMNISGNFYRKKLTYLALLLKHMNTNQACDPYPIRPQLHLLVDSGGMLPTRTARPGHPDKKSV